MTECFSDCSLDVMRRASLRSWQRQWNREAQSNSEQKSNKKHQLWLNILTSNQPLFPITERKTEHLQMIHSYIIKSMEYVERIEPHALIHAGCDVTCPHNNQAEQGHVIYKSWWSSPALFTKTEKWMDTLSFKELQRFLEKHERQTYVNRNIATYASKRYPAIHCNL